MHDYHAVAELIERIASQTEDLERVAEVRIRAGAAYSPGALEQAWEMLTQDSPLEGSRIVVEESPTEGTCSACGSSWTVSREDVTGHVVVCPSCGVPSAIERRAGIEVLAVTAAPAAL